MRLARSPSPSPPGAAPCSDSVSLRLRPEGLRLATRDNSQAHSSIGTPSGLPVPRGTGIALRLLVGTRFQVLFHSPPGVLFTFPSRYSCAIGRREYLALEGGPPGFPRGSSCPVVLGNAVQEVLSLSATGLSPSVARRSRTVRLERGLLTSRPVRSPVRPRPTTPRGQRLRAWHPRGLGYLPFRSPLLRESRLISFPPGTEMFQFPDLPPHRVWIPRWVTGHDPRRVSPFGHVRIAACLAAPRTFRRRQRPSSAPDAKASTVRPW